MRTAQPPTAGGHSWSRHGPMHCCGRAFTFLAAVRPQHALTDTTAMSGSPPHFFLRPKTPPMPPAAGRRGIARARPFIAAAVLTRHLKFTTTTGTRRKRSLMKPADRRAHWRPDDKATVTCWSASLAPPGQRHPLPGPLMSNSGKMALRE